ncbi:hypothetical protein PO909_027019 [Leuciscus waleckii]
MRIVGLWRAGQYSPLLVFLLHSLLPLIRSSNAGNQNIPRLQLSHTGLLIEDSKRADDLRGAICLRARGAAAKKVQEISTADDSGSRALAGGNDTIGTLTLNRAREKNAAN